MGETLAQFANIGWVVCRKCRGTRFHICLNLEDCGLLLGEDQLNCDDPIKGVVCADCAEPLLVSGRASFYGVEGGTFRGELPPTRLGTRNASDPD
jgi:hypothetical protein